MSTTPLCPVCGRSAWPAQAWQHKNCTAQRIPPEVVVANAPEIAVTNEKVVANRHGQYADKEKRREYMRNYMAKRRAA